MRNNQNRSIVRLHLLTLTAMLAHEDFDSGYAIGVAQPRQNLRAVLEFTVPINYPMTWGRLTGVARQNFGREPFDTPFNLPGNIEIERVVIDGVEQDAIPDDGMSISNDAIVDVYLNEVEVELEEPDHDSIPLSYAEAPGTDDLSDRLREIHRALGGQTHRSSERQTDEAEIELEDSTESTNREIIRDALRNIASEHYEGDGDVVNGYPEMWRTERPGANIAVEDTDAFIAAFVADLQSVFPDAELLYCGRYEEGHSGHSDAMYRARRDDAYVLAGLPHHWVVTLGQSETVNGREIGIYLSAYYSHVGEEAGRLVSIQPAYGRIVPAFSERERRFATRTQFSDRDVRIVAHCGGGYETTGAHCLSERNAPGVAMQAISSCRDRYS